MLVASCEDFQINSPIAIANGLNEMNMKDIAADATKCYFSADAIGIHNHSIYEPNEEETINSIASFIQHDIYLNCNNITSINSNSNEFDFEMKKLNPKFGGDDPSFIPNLDDCYNSSDIFHCYEEGLLPPVHTIKRYYIIFRYHI